MISLKIVTPQIILNYAALMEEHKFFEESFKVYEKGSLCLSFCLSVPHLTRALCVCVIALGVALFPHPHAYPIWAAYLTKFIGRFKGTKLERTRGSSFLFVPGIVTRLCFSHSFSFVLISLSAYSCEQIFLSKLSRRRLRKKPKNSFCCLPNMRKIMVWVRFAANCPPRTMICSF